MKAAYMSKFGGPEVFKVGEFHKPYPQAGEVLVRITACGLNYYDTLVRQGAVSKEIPLPHIPGSDVVGYVEQVGDHNSCFSVGDSVIVAPGFPVEDKEQDYKPENYAHSYYPGGTFTHGGYAQYMVIHERWLVSNNTELSDHELATLPLVLVTAMHTTKILGQASPGKKVLVHAGASGSGSMAIQVAKACGAEVITTVSSQSKAALAQKLGADEVIYYQEDDFVEVSKEWSNNEGVDLIIDNLGGDVFQKNLDALRWGGTLVNFGLLAGMEASIPNVYSFFRGQYQVLGSFMGTLDELQEGLEWVRLGKIKPVLDDVLSLDHVAEAHARIDHRQVAGNLVLDPWA